MDFRRFFEASPAAVLALEAAEPFRIVAVTEEYLNVTRTRRDEIVGRGIFEVFPDNPAEATASGVRNLRASLRRVASQGVRDTMALQQYDIPSSGAGAFETRWWSPTNAPVFGADGRLQYILHRVDDVTEYICHRQSGGPPAAHWALRERLTIMESQIYERTREAQETNCRLEAANARLADEAARKSEFLAVLAHELRTPFAALSLRLQGLKRQGPPIGSFTETLDKALRQTQRIRGFIDDMLDYAEFGTGRHKERPVPIDLEAFVRAIVEERTLVRPAQVNIVSPPLAMVGTWEPSRLEHIVGNVLDNALKFGNGLPIEVRIEEETGKALIHIQDHGIGIEAEKLGAIFERFVRASPIDSYPGLGLGLAIVREFAATLGGEILVTSKPGDGSTFTIVLPLD